MEYVRTHTREFEVGPSVELSIDSRSGTVNVRGDDTERVRVEVVARLWAESDDEADDQLALIARGIRQDGKRVNIRAPALVAPSIFMIFGRGPRIDYQVTVPKAALGTVVSRSGRVEIEGIAGPLEVDVRSGRIGVRDIGADTRIISRSGSVQVESVRGSVVIESRSGSLRLGGCTGNATVISRSGSVQIEDVGGSLKLESRSGSVRYDGPVRGEFDISVVSGSVRLSVDADSRFFLDAESAHGSEQSDLPMRRDSQRGASDERGPTVRVRTRSGSIHIGTR